MSTQKYRGLKKRLEILRKIYLPRTFSPTGSYNNAQYEKVRAYEVLVHAEMEYYFEELALSIAQKAYNKWKNKRKASIPLIAMVVYYSGKYPSTPETHTGNFSQEDVDHRINEAYRDYNYRKSNNHGIKEKNILSLFLPIGIQIDSIDADMLIALSNFGRERGNIAHSTRATTVLSPDDALRAVNELMTYIDSFDQLLSEFKKAI